MKYYVTFIGDWDSEDVEADFFEESDTGALAFFRDDEHEPVYMIADRQWHSIERVEEPEINCHQEQNDFAHDDDAQQWDVENLYDGGAD